MGQLKKKPDTNCSTNEQKIAPILMYIFLYLIAFSIVATFFAQSLSWLLREIDQLRPIILIGEPLQMSLGQTTTSSKLPTPTHSILTLLALPSILTWLFGIIAAKIGDSFVDFCWQIIKLFGKNAWNKIKNNFQINF